MFYCWFSYFLNTPKNFVSFEKVLISWIHLSLAMPLKVIKVLRLWVDEDCTTWGLNLKLPCLLYKGSQKGTIKIQTHYCSSQGSKAHTNKKFTISNLGIAKNFRLGVYSSHSVKMKQDWFRTSFLDCGKALVMYDDKGLVEVNNNSYEYLLKNVDTNLKHVFYMFHP